MTAQLIPEEISPWTAEPVTPASRGRLRAAIRRLRQTIQEMNYASRRVVELQAPWCIDTQSRSR